MDYDAIVLGGGVSGLVSAALLARQGKRVLLADEYDGPGGNHIAVDIGAMTFDIGSFFFQDDSPLLAHFPDLLPLYQDIGSYTIARLTPFGAIARYPVDMRREFLGTGPVECARILLSVLWARLRVDPGENADSYARYWIGARFADRSGLRHYLARFYGTPPARIEAVFAEKRMGWIANPARRVLEARRPRPPGPPPNRQLIRPRAGFGALYAAAVRTLQAEGVQVLFGQSLTGMERAGDGAMQVHTAAGSHRAPLVVSTIPLNRARALCALPEAPGIRSATLISLFCSFQGDRGFDANVLYNFSHGGAWKRLTVYSDFYGPCGGRIHFTVEVIRSEGGVSAEDAYADFVSHIAQGGILRGDLRLEGARVTGHAYPVYLDGASLAAETALAELRDFGVLSYGRQGGFDYQPTARVSTLVAEDRLADLRDAVRSGAQAGPGAPGPVVPDPVVPDPAIPDPGASGIVLPHTAATDTVFPEDPAEAAPAAPVAGAASGAPPGRPAAP